MDVGNPSNFDRLMWLYRGDLGAIRRDIAGSRHDDGEVRATIRAVYEKRGYLLDPHSAIAYLGLKGQEGIFLATAHPAKFAEVVEPIIGRTIPKPQPLLDALATKRKILEIDATLDAVNKVLG
jgi:threonine synthase